MSATHWDGLGISRARQESIVDRKSSTAFGRIATRFGLVLEGLIACSVALAFVLICRSIDVDPVDRVGQVSGLAGVQLRAAIFGGIILATTLLQRRFAYSPLGFDRVVMAATAGMLTAVTAGGNVVALHDTPWGLFAYFGDAGRIAEWADATVAGGSITVPHYPPTYLWLVGLYAKFRGTPTAFALKDVGIITTCLVGPVSYLSWRIVVSARRALLLALVLSVVLMDLYKPYSTLVLVTFPALAVALVALARRLSQVELRVLAWRSGAIGASFGALFTIYPGWFVWAAPGLVIALVGSTIWRAGLRRSFTFLMATLGGFLVVAGAYLRDFLGVTEEADAYFYFDTFVEPAYIAMFRGDLPGNVGPWPPPGEFGGVGLFTVGLLSAVTVALWVGRSHPGVATGALLAAGGWVIRMLLASRMFETQTVQLYPRTTSAILAALLVTASFGFFVVYDRLSELGSLSTRNRLSPPAVAVTFFALAFAAVAGSSTADRYMPSESGLGVLARYSHITPLPDGSCPRFAPGTTCTLFVPPK